MLFITTQPDSDYYIWQLQVQLNNFKKFGCEDKCIVIFGYNPTIGVNPNAISFAETTSAFVIYYPDNRDLSSRLYSPSIKPHLLKQLYKNNPEVIFNRNYVYLDCDILLTNYPKFNVLNEEKYIHLSNTNTMFSFENIMMSNQLIFEKMCRIVGVTPLLVKRNLNFAGGMIYCFKFFHYFDYQFWDKVERDSNDLYKMMLVINNQIGLDEIMTANKWALLWNLWLIGYDTKISEELSTSWAKSPINEWNNHNFYNNSGISSKDRDYLFYKGDFEEKTPFKTDFLYVSKEYCSSKYVEEIEATRMSLNLDD